jgi:hypothetical protein
MKVEYSYYADRPSLIIKATDFLKALKDNDELYLLEIAVEGFGIKFNATPHFDERVNKAIQQWLTKASNVIYTIKERWAGRTVLNTWCEVYVLDGTRLTEIVFSDDYGRNFILKDKQEVDG